MSWNIDDLQSHINAIETVISGRITSDVENYSIAGRQITKIPLTELLVIRDRLKRELSNMKAAQSVAAGLGNPRKILTRF